MRVALQGVTLRLFGKFRERSQHPPKPEEQIVEESEPVAKPEALLGREARRASVSTGEEGWKARG